MGSAFLGRAEIGARIDNASWVPFLTVTLPQMSESLQILCDITLFSGKLLPILDMALSLLSWCAEEWSRKPTPSYSPEKAELSARGGRKATGHQSGLPICRDWGDRRAAESETISRQRVALEADHETKHREESNSQRRRQSHNGQAKRGGGGRLSRVRASAARARTSA